MRKTYFHPKTFMEELKETNDQVWFLNKAVISLDIASRHSLNLLAYVKQVGTMEGEGDVKKRELEARLVEGGGLRKCIWWVYWGAFVFFVLRVLGLFCVLLDCKGLFFSWLTSSCGIWLS